ncbi:MAG: MgtC/SapB family protein [candidate division KSB1 bacterium]|nr:MgtC/SapB family protein [candidate division KSB1 bacterium]
MNYHNIFLKFGISLLIGLLVGIQREYAIEKENKESTTGVRTLALMGMIGCAAAMLTEQMGSPWPYVAIVLIGGALLITGFITESQNNETGLTTEFASLLTILNGSLVYMDHMPLAIALTVTIVTILSLKIEIHEFVKQIDRQDILATLKFALISAIILPVLPNQNYGPEPFNIFNPYKIWLLVVFISGISFIGYILIKLAGAKRGITLLGLLGGLASSTAVTLTLTQRSKANPELSKSFAQAIILAWTVMYIRLLIIVGAINIKLVQLLWLPVLVTVSVGILYVFILYKVQREPSQLEHVTFANPFELGPAIKFGIIFSVVLLLSKVAQIYFGDTGIYIASLVSGLADVDAIALSVSRMSNQPQGIHYNIAARAILLAGVSNTLLKGIVSMAGDKTLPKALLPGTALLIITATAFVFFL